MDLIINNHIITEPIENILLEIRRCASWPVFKDMKIKSNYIQVTCPYHKDGQEKHPSATINIDDTLDNIPPGFFNCFTCHTAKPLDALVADILNVPLKKAREWLVEKFGNLLEDDPTRLFSKWEEESSEASTEYLNPDILKPFAFYHPYLASRGIPFEIAQRFQVGWDQAQNCIVFPVWDENNNLVMLTKRSIKYKYFYIQDDRYKPIYLLNEVLNIKSKVCAIVESQFNALTSWTYGLPAGALLGTGADYQYDILANTDINHFILLFDGDEAGRKGAMRFKKYMPKDKFITDIKLPAGKDVNDLSKDEFWSLINSSLNSDLM